MKKHIITALLITTMISMTACGGNKNTDTPAEETVVATEATGELPTANDEKVVLGTLNKEETAPVETTAEAKADAKADAKSEVKATATPDPKATEAPKSTQAPETTAKPKSTTKPGTQTASVTATTKPAATEKPKSTTAPKATATPAPKATAAPKATEAPKATAAPKATPTPTAAPVACQHTNTHVESSHDTYEVPIAGGCYEVWVSATRVCNDCGANLGENKEKVNEVHTNVVHKQGVSATCTTDGYSAVYGCDCGRQPEVGGDVIPAFGHDYVNEWDHDETDAEGKDHVYFHSICRNCGDISSVWEE